MGIFLHDLANVLRGAGLDVIECEGWRTRGWRGSTTPDGGLRALRGGLVHHTATSIKAPGDYPSLRIVRDGRTDVPGPLAQLGLGRSGTWYVIAAGRANHSGAVDDPDYANPVCIGVEAEHPGDDSPWPPAQYASYVRGCRAIEDAYSIRIWRGHKEAAVPPGRKIDPRFDMNTFRAAVSGAPTTTTEDDDMFSDADRAKLDLDHYAINKVILPALSGIAARVAKLAAADPAGDVDEAAIVAGVLAGLDPATIAAAIPDGIAASVADEIGRRLA